jgi:hypothetical protein
MFFDSVSYLIPGNDTFKISSDSLD